MEQSQKGLTTPEDLSAIGHQARPILSAIREKCFDCSGGSWNEVADCLVRKCALYPFRMGKNPWRKPMSEDNRLAAKERMLALKASNPAVAQPSDDITAASPAA